jgi:hypothetical protein
MRLAQSVQGGLQPARESPFQTNKKKKTRTKKGQEKKDKEGPVQGGREKISEMGK